MKRYPTVDAYIAGQLAWKAELTRLREILQSTDLVETVKWGAPCYTFAGRNVVGIGAFKSYFGLWFFQGVFLPDREGVLLNCQEGRTRGLRQWRMNSMRDIRRGTIRAYVKQAIELAKAGKQIKPERGKPVIVPPQMLAALNDDPQAAQAFRKLTLGKQREYAQFIEMAKRDDTKIRRLKRILPMIVKGIGLNDHYRK